MAGGPSTPALTAAVSKASGYGSIAAGFRPAELLRKAIALTRSLTGAQFGVNLFVPSVPADADEVSADAAARKPEAERLGVALDDAHWEDNAYDDKLAVVESTRVHVVSFTFDARPPTSRAAAPG